MTTSEIVKRLREFSDFYSRRPSVKNRTPTLAEITERECRDVADQSTDAADRIEALEAENKRLRAALEPFANAGTMTFMSDGLVDVKLFIADILAARAALREET